MKKETAILIASVAGLLWIGASDALTGKMIINVKDTENEKTIALQLANLGKQLTNIYSWN